MIIIVILLTFMVLSLDYIWIKYILMNPFIKMVENIQKTQIKPRLFGALITYIAIMYIIIMIFPKLDSIYEAILLGISIYAIYDGTNYATISNWDLRVAIPDTLWGGVLFGIVYKIYTILRVKI